MSDPVGEVAWRDISGRGTCYSLDGDGSVGSLRGSAFWSGADKAWCWCVERVNKTRGPRILRSGTAASAEDARHLASLSRRRLLGASEMPLFTGEGKEAP